MADKEILEQFQTVLEAIGKVETSLREEMNAKFKEVDKRFNDVDKRLNDVDKRLNDVDKRLKDGDMHFRGLESRMDSMEASIISKIVTGDDIERIADRAASKAGAIIENTAFKQLAALNNGFKQNHDKQQELERRTETLENAVDDIRSRIA